MAQGELRVVTHHPCKVLHWHHHFWLRKTEYEFVAISARSAMSSKVGHTVKSL